VLATLVRGQRIALAIRDGELSRHDRFPHRTRSTRSASILLVVIASLYHMSLGMQEVIVDYIASPVHPKVAAAC
jgi:succinate dehydrogenase hydrophobic anchor subunit